MLNLNIPVNSVSFGFCSFHILLELFKRGIDVNLFPIGPVDLTSYPAARRTPFFEDWLKKSIYLAGERFNRTDKTFSLWHIKDSEKSIGVKRNLLTFNELSELTPLERNTLNNQDVVFVTNSYSQNIFQKNGVSNNIVVCPLGFDNYHFTSLSKRAYSDDRIVFGLFGKLEVSRKRHAKVIQSWIKKFGGDRRYQLHLHVFNPHLNLEQNAQLLNQIIGNRPFNVNILPQVNDLDLYNKYLNATDIVMDMGTEGWSIPSFSAVALGKHGVILNFAGLSEWANKENSILIEPNEMIEPYDNMFFHKGSQINQGLIADFNEEEFISGCETAINKFLYSPVNVAGLVLQDKFTWEKTVNIILDNLK